MGTLMLFRILAIIVEVSVLMALIYSIFNGARYALFDYGLDEKYSEFIRLMVVIVGCIALAFFAAHLITFYPSLAKHF
jgi:hypothetical protein